MARSDINDLVSFVRPGLAAMASWYGDRKMVKPEWSIIIAPEHVKLMFAGRTEIFIYDPVTRTYDDDDLIGAVVRVAPGRMREWDSAVTVVA